MPKTIAIAGYGIEGKSSLEYFQGLGLQPTVFDDNAQVLETVLPQYRGGSIEDLRSAIRSFDLVARTPSIDPKLLSGARELTSTTKEFFRQCSAPIIGITGTKGKGTTCSLTTNILEAAGFKVHLLGNIGETTLDKLATIKPDDIVVYELSSFQLWDLDIGPKIAVVLMIEQDHLDIHRSIDDYLEAKSNISRFQLPTDIVIYHPNNPLSKRVACAGSATRKRYLTDEAVYLKGDNIMVNEQIICSTFTVRLIGEHNLENVCAAISAAWEFTKDLSAIAKGVATFKGLEHRLEPIGSVNGVSFYDDSIATNPSSAIAAVKSFKQPIILILGGSDKQASYDNLAEVIAESSVKKVILVGQTKQAIAKAMANAGYNGFDVSEAADMATIVQAAVSEASEGDVVLLSPACASFDMFESYKQRGQLFKQAVARLRDGE